jgi:heme exporter protein D
MALLVAGAAAGSLALVYSSIGVSVLAALTLAAGVLLRRREIFGGAGDSRERAAAGGTEDTPETPVTAGTPDAGNAGDAAPAGEEVTIVPGVARYHRRECILIRFLGDGDLGTMTRQAAQAAGSVPCKACQPDEPAQAG